MSCDCIITGTSGMLGRALVPLLAESGLSTFKVAGRANLDLLDAQALEQLPEASVLIHLAALSGPELAWKDPERVLDNNFRSTLNLLGWCRKNGVKRFVFASSYLYGAPQYLPVDENHPVHPANAYAASKYLCEQLGQEYTRWGIDFVALRFFNLVGPGQGPEFLIPTITKQLQTLNEVRLFSSRPLRDYVDTLDAAHAILKAMTCHMEAPFQAFNIGSGKAIAVPEIVAGLLKVSGRRVPVHYSEDMRPNEVLEVVADISRARRILAWTPRISFELSLEKVWRASLESKNDACPLP